MHCALCTAEYCELYIYVRVASCLMVQHLYVDFFLRLLQYLVVEKKEKYTPESKVMMVNNSIEGLKANVNIIWIKMLCSRIFECLSFPFLFFRCNISCAYVGKLFRNVFCCFYYISYFWTNDRFHATFFWFIKMSLCVKHFLKYFVFFTFLSISIFSFVSRLIVRLCNCFRYSFLSLVDQHLHLLAFMCTELS